MAPSLMASARIWLAAARLRTLPAAVAPVLVGTALGAVDGTLRPLAFAAALVGALLIQVGTNLSNDYSDARRGADTEDRLGPVRVTAGGLVPPRQVLVATYVTFAAAVAVGLYLVAVAGWELLAVGAASILAGVLYTGGPRPYGYEGLGELFVFLFFGVVAVSRLLLRAGRAAGVGGVRAGRPGGPAGRRDPGGQQRARPGHRPPGGQADDGGAPGARPRPGGVRGDGAGRLCDGPGTWLAGALSAWVLAPLVTLPLALGLIRTVSRRVDGPALNAALARTGMLQLAFCTLLAAGVLASR